jgi:hypothetical protein
VRAIGWMPYKDTKRKSCDGCTSAVENMAYVKARTPRLEGTMFNWKTWECAQEIFAFTLGISVLLALASAIPA